MAGNDMLKLMRLIESGGISVDGIQHIQVAHDSYCAMNNGRECNCDPDIESRNAEDCRDTIIPGLGRVQ